MTDKEKMHINALYGRILIENDIALINEMLYVCGCIEFDIIKAHIRRRVNREYIRRSHIRMPWTEYIDYMRYKRESERENNPQRLRRGHF